MIAHVFLVTEDREFIGPFPTVFDYDETDEKLFNPHKTRIEHKFSERTTITHTLVVTKHNARLIKNTEPAVVEAGDTIECLPYALLLAI